MIPPGLEPGTFRVLGERDNHYTTESWPLFSEELFHNELDFDLKSLKVITCSLKGNVW